MLATRRVRQEPGEKPYEWTWALEYEDGSMVAQYTPMGQALFDAQDQTGLKALLVQRHPAYRHPEETASFCGLRIACSRISKLVYEGQWIDGKGPLERKTMLVIADGVRLRIVPHRWRIGEDDPLGRFTVEVESHGGLQDEMEHRGE